MFYSFVPLEGDSGGGVFDDAGSLTGVVWGTSGKSGAVVPLDDLRAVLDSPACCTLLENEFNHESRCTHDHHAAPPGRP